jgi:uncharacterized membrane protein
VQLAVSLTCDQVFSTSYKNVDIASVCITIPSVTDEVCGWQALEACNDLTSLRMWIIALGSMLLIWCHLIWLMLVLGSVNAQREYMVVHKEEEEEE